MNPKLYIRVNATINCYCSYFEPKTGDARRASPEWKKSLLEVQREQFTGTCFARDLQQHEKVGNGQGKQTIPPAHCCARDTPTSTSVLRLLVLYLVVYILPEKLLSAARCRVDCHRANAGLVALGESSADRSGEASLIPNYIQQVVVKATTTKCYRSIRRTYLTHSP